MKIIAISNNNHQILYKQIFNLIEILIKNSVFFYYLV